jgi:regulatory factor X
MPSQVGNGQHMFNNPEDMLMRFGHQLSHHSNGGSLDQSMQDTHTAIPRAEDFPNHPMQGHAMSHHSIQSDIPNGLPNVPVPQYQPIYDSGVENHLPDHLVEEQEISEPGGKKKRGASSTVANDNELRKLLRQYEGWSLKQMAAEVMKNEGGGGKAEKVKQVFAMIW